VRHVITNLMEYFLEHPEEMGQEVPPAAATGDTGTAEGGGDPSLERRERIQAVTDYISGMTDRYAISRYRELFEPRSWAAP
jgi:dGTPase